MGKRGPMTEEAKAARLAKRRATLEAKKSSALAEMGVERKAIKPIRAKRQLTDKQKKAATKRLEKARAVKAANSDPKYVTVADNVRALPDNNPLSLVSVRRYLKAAKEHLAAVKGLSDSKDSKERDTYNTWATYVANLESYIRTGDYADSRYGEMRQNKIRVKVTHMAYYPDGTPKRDVGFVYKDVGLWTEEMDKPYRQKLNETRSVASKRKKK